MQEPKTNDEGLKNKNYIPRRDVLEHKVSRTIRKLYYFNYWDSRKKVSVKWQFSGIVFPLFRNKEFLISNLANTIQVKEVL